MTFKKGQKVVKVITGAGVKTAYVDVVEKVSKGQVKLSNDEHLRYSNLDGQEIDPVIFGFDSEIIALDE